MSWAYDDLWLKAKVFAQRGFDHRRDEPQFPFWCSLAVELLARASLAKIHPALLADKRDADNLMYAFGYPPAKSSFRPKSLNTEEILDRCNRVVPGFTRVLAERCQELAGARNEELHSGGVPFEAMYQAWLPEFLEACGVLLAHQGRSFDDFLGKDEADAARRVLNERREEVKGVVGRAIASAKANFDAKTSEERERLAAEAEQDGERESRRGKHRAKCPACESVGLIDGEALVPKPSRLEGAKIVRHIPMLPTSFACSACELELRGYAQLDEGKLGAQYSRTITWDPLEYYLPSEGEGYDNE